MKCAWQAFLNLLPQSIKEEVHILGKQNLLELRLRMNADPELVFQDRSVWINHKTTPEDISFIINVASRYSPWAAGTIRRGFITAEGGHRIGLCGDAVIHKDEMTGIRNPVSLCIRVARDFPGIALNAKKIEGSVLIIGPPGSGKTTFLRDLIRQYSDFGKGSIGVVDERGELFPLNDQGQCFYSGKRTDVITGCSKAQGIELLLRTMGPSCIAVDEITAEEDSRAILNAGWSGVNLLATAHAKSKSDLFSRGIYRPIVNSGLFQRVLIMDQDKSWKEEYL